MPAKAVSKRYARPVIPVLFGLIWGIVAAFYVPNLSFGSIGVLLSATACTVMTAFRQPVRVLPLLLFFCLGYWNLQTWILPPEGPCQVTRFMDDKPWHILGVVKDVPQHFPDRSRFSLHLRSLSRNGAVHPVSGAIRVTVKGGAKNLRRGDWVTCLARLKKIRNFNNPGGFDYERYMAFKGLHATAYIGDPALVARLSSTQAGGWRRWMDRMDRTRAAIIRFIDQVPPGDARGIVKALIVGDRFEISSANRQLFSRVGVSHLLAISGLHVGMVASLAFFVFRKLLAQFDRILLAAWVTRGAALLSIGPVIFYGLLAGMSPSTQRAVVMVTVFLLAVVLDRESDPFNTVAVAAWVILLISPTALFHVAFQLSFAAVLAILYVLDRLPWGAKLRSFPLTLWKKTALLLLVSMAAILGTLPITLYYFNQTSFIGIAANCVLVPILTFVVIPLGLLVVILVPLSSAAASLALTGALFVTDWCLELARLFDRIPFAAAKTVTPSLLEIGIYYAFLWCVLNCRSRRWVRGALMIVIAAALLDIGFWYRQRFCRNELRTTFIDVGQGSAVLIELPHGGSMLVDGGGFYGNVFDVGERIIAPFLWRKKIATVETLVLSHPNADHLNGLLFIARHFNVEEIWSNQEPHPSRAYTMLQEIVADKHIRPVRLNRRSSPRWADGVRFEALYPPRGFLERRGGEPWRTTNNNSVVLKVCFQKRCLLLCGDIEAEAERELVHLGCDELASDVLFVPHHGSKSSSTPGFVGCVDPSVAVISAGWENPFGFPHQQVMQTYRRMGCRILRTDRHGAVTVITDGFHTEIQTHLSAGAVVSQDVDFKNLAAER